MFVHDFLRNHLLESRGVFPSGYRKPDLDVLKETEWDFDFFNMVKSKLDSWDPRFELLIRNRMIMGYFRYGGLREKKPKYNNIGSIAKRFSFYEETGNAEFLIDNAALCLVEYAAENFSPTKDDIVWARMSYKNWKHFVSGYESTDLNPVNLLVDIVCLCHIEFTTKTHKNFHWEASDDADHHVQPKEEE